MTPLMAAGATAVVLTSVTPRAAADRAPIFEVDAAWSPPLPNGWVSGDPSSVAVDRHDRVWVLQRPRTIPAERRASAAPAVIEYGADGRFVRAWGGPNEKNGKYDWPDLEHGIFVDQKDHVWVTGASQPRFKRPRADDMVLKFTPTGELIRQIGGRDMSSGNLDTRNPKGPTDVFVYPKTNEAFIADGYGNCRVWVVDADSAAFKRLWGAFGRRPSDGPCTAAPAVAVPLDKAAEALAGPLGDQFNNVHAIRVSNDGLVYVADRYNRRIQVFTVDGTYVSQMAITLPAGIGFSPESTQQFMYVADMAGRIDIVDRKALKTVSTVGKPGAKHGEFQNLVQLAVDSKGNLYTAEVAPGSRLQKFVLKGFGPTTSDDVEPRSAER
jgi:DNA-binding beta-propeller fold protein YncE